MRCGGRPRPEPRNQRESGSVVEVRRPPAAEASKPPVPHSRSALTGFRQDGGFAALRRPLLAELVGGPPNLVSRSLAELAQLNQRSRRRRRRGARRRGPSG